MTSRPQTVADLLPHLSLIEADLGQIALPRSIALDFDVFLPGHGWYAPERSATTWFRWLDREAMISLLIDRSEPMSGELQIFNCIAEDVLDGLELFCDESPIRSRIVRRREDWICCFELPIRPAMKAELTVLRVRSAYQRKVEGDSRSLSLAFSTLILDPTVERKDATDSVLPLALQALSDEIFTVVAGKPWEDDRASTWRFEYRGIGSVDVMDAPQDAPEEERAEIWSISLIQADYAGFQGGLTFQVVVQRDFALLLRFRRGSASGTLATLFCDDFEVAAARSSAFSDLSVFPNAPISRTQLRAALALLDALPGIIEQSASSQAVPSHRLLPLLTSGITVDMKHPLEGIPGIVRISGLGHAESWPEGFIRWTSSNELVIVLSHLPHGDIKMSLVVERVYAPCLPTSIQFKCGSVRKDVALSREAEILEFPIAAGGMGNKISVAMPDAISPAQVGEGSDVRTLCLALRAIHIRADIRE